MCRSNAGESVASMVGLNFQSLDAVVCSGSNLIMFIKVTRSDHRGLESSEDQISADVRDVVQVPKSDLMASGVAIDLLQVAKRVGPQREAAEHEDLSREEGFSLDSVIIDD